MEWNTITIRKFLELKEFKPSDDLKGKILALTIVTGKDAEFFNNMEIGKLREYIKTLSVTDLPKDKLIRYFKLKGIRFRVNTDITTYNAADYIDIMNYCKDKERINDNMANILAVICKPYKWWGLKKVAMKKKEIAALFYDNLTLDIAYPVSVFFWKLWNSLTDNIKTSLDKRIETLKMETQRQIASNEKHHRKMALAKDGVGS